MILNVSYIRMLAFKHCIIKRLLNSVFRDHSRIIKDEVSVISLCLQLGMIAPINSSLDYSGLIT